MRVLIADDESLARSNIRSILQDLQLPLRIVGEAANGEELIELVKQQSPDLVFVDIKMPKMNGLEAIRLGQSFSPHTKWFILTGYSNFDYAKEAIRLGATDYLLKPVDPAELDILLRKAYDDYNQHCYGLNKDFERDIMALYHGVSSLEQEERDSYLLQATFVGAVLYIDSCLPEKAKAELQLALVQHIRDIITQAITNNVRIALFGVPDGELALVAAWLDKTMPLEKRKVETFLRQIQEAIKEFDNDTFKVTVFQSDYCRSYEALNARLDHLQRLAYVRSVLGIGRKWQYRDLEASSQDQILMALAQLLLSLYEAARNANYLDFSYLLSKLGKVLPASNIHQDAALRAVIADFVNCSIGCQLRTDQSPDLWMQLLAERSEQLLGEGLSAEQPDLVNKVIAFVEANYHFDIGVGQIAERLKITPNYLSAVFRKKTGTTFVRYLTNVRMSKAKEFLVDPSLQIQQVAERVGYFNSRYFAKLFTEICGCNPSEYRRTQLVR
jgi:two-component system, response regulator YesN